MSDKTKTQQIRDAVFSHVTKQAYINRNTIKFTPFPNRMVYFMEDTYPIVMTRLRTFVLLPADHIWLKKSPATESIFQRTRHRGYLVKCLANVKTRIDLVLWMSDPINYKVNELRAMNQYFTSEQLSVIRNSGNNQRWLVLEYSNNLPMDIREIDAQLVMEQAIDAQIKSQAKLKNKLL